MNTVLKVFKLDKDSRGKQLEVFLSTQIALQGDKWPKSSLSTKYRKNPILCIYTYIARSEEKVFEALAWNQAVESNS